MKEKQRHKSVVVKAEELKEKELELMKQQRLEFLDKQKSKRLTERAEYEKALNASPNYSSNPVPLYK